MIACPHCQQTVNDDAIHCGYCGQRVVAEGASDTIFGVAPVIPAKAGPDPAPVTAPAPAPPPSDDLDEDNEDNTATLALMPAIRLADLAPAPAPAEPAEPEERAITVPRGEAVPPQPSPEAEPGPEPEPEVEPDPDPDPKSSAHATVIMDSPFAQLETQAMDAISATMPAPAEDSFDDVDERSFTRRTPTARSLLMTALLAVPLIGILAGLAIYFGGGELRVRFESRVARDAEHDAFDVTLGVLIEEGDPEERLVLSFSGKDEEFVGSRSLRYRVLREELQVGVNVRQADIRTADGAIVGRFPVSIVVDYEFSVEGTTLGPTDRVLKAYFKVPDGSALYVDGGEPEAVGDGRLVVSIGLDRLLDRIDTLPDAEYPFQIRFRVRRADGREVAYTESVALKLPEVLLEVHRPPRLYVTTSAKIKLAGRVDPEAKLSVGGKAVRIRKDGTFYHDHALPSPGDHQVEIVAEKAGLVDVKRSLEVQRFTRTELDDLWEEARLTAEDWAGPDASRGLAYPELRAAVAGPLKGEKAVVRGKILSVQQGPGAVVLIVSTCGRRPDCAVWAESAGRITVGTGDTVTLYGILDGERTLPGPKGGERQVPLMNKVLAVGG